MCTHPDTNLVPGRPRVPCEVRLGLGCSEDRVARGLKRVEEGITLGVDLVALVRDEGGAQYPTMLGQEIRIELSRALEQARRAFDVREEESDLPGRRLDHLGSDYCAVDLIRPVEVSRGECCFG